MAFSLMRLEQQLRSEMALKRSSHWPTHYYISAASVEPTSRVCEPTIGNYCADGTRSMITDALGLQVSRLARLICESNT